MPEWSKGEVLRSSAHRARGFKPHWTQMAFGRILLCREGGATLQSVCRMTSCGLPCYAWCCCCFCVLQRLGCNAELIVDEFGAKLLEELDYLQVGGGEQHEKCAGFHVAGWSA